MDWQRADLLTWGEYMVTPRGIYRKTWVYSDCAQNADGLMFEIRGSDGGLIAACEDEADADAVAVGAAYNTAGPHNYVCSSNLRKGRIVRPIERNQQI